MSTIQQEQYKKLKLQVKLIIVDAKRLNKTLANRNQQNMKSNVQNYIMIKLDLSFKTQSFTLTE